jgi:hypothetical protein
MSSHTILYDFANCHYAWVGIGLNRPSHSAEGCEIKKFYVFMTFQLSSRLYDIGLIRGTKLDLGRIRRCL